MYKVLGQSEPCNTQILSQKSKKQSLQSQLLGSRGRSVLWVPGQVVFPVATSCTHMHIHTLMSSLGNPDFWSLLEVCPTDVSKVSVLFPLVSRNTGKPGYNPFLNAGLKNDISILCALAFCWSYKQWWAIIWDLHKRWAISPALVIILKCTCSAWMGQQEKQVAWGQPGPVSFSCCFQVETSVCLFPRCAPRWWERLHKPQHRACPHPIPSHPCSTVSPTESHLAQV